MVGGRSSSGHRLLEFCCPRFLLLACCAIGLSQITGDIPGFIRAIMEKVVHVKTGTFVEGESVRGQAFAGYVSARSGRVLAYQVVVNIPFKDISDVIQIFQNEGIISAILWRDN